MCNQKKGLLVEHSGGGPSATRFLSSYVWKPTRSSNRKTAPERSTRKPFFGCTSGFTLPKECPPQFAEFHGVCPNSPQVAGNLCGEPECTVIAQSAAICDCHPRSPDGGHCRSPEWASSSEKEDHRHPSSVHARYWGVCHHQAQSCSPPRASFVSIV